VTNKMDPRVKAFGSYLEEQIAAQQQRPYSDRESIEANLQIYKQAEEIYLRLSEINSLPGINKELYNEPINELEISVRARCVLKRLGVETLGQLVEKKEDELLADRRCGLPSLNQIKSQLELKGLSLKT
jgi:DNA-directed RNA polymerase alpha subunit